MNKKGGFDCQSCAWPSPDEGRKIFEFCENGVKAVTDEGTKHSVAGDFFSRYSIKELQGKSDLWMGQQGRLTKPMVKRPGGTPYELFEPLGLEYTEVLRGANAFDAGAVDLGGAIDYVSKTGHDALPADIRVEAGSFGYTKEQLSSGKVIGPLDYYISLTNSYRSG